MTAADFLEREKIDELEAQLREQGYVVERNKRFEDVEFDLVARKGDDKIAYEVKAASKLGKGNGVDLARLREIATANGISNFKVFVVNPPRHREVTIENLEERLRDHLSETLPSELRALASSVQISSVSHLELEEVTIEKDAVRAVGSGVVEVELEYGGGDAKDGLDLSTDFPFHFDVLLDRNLDVMTVNRLTVDTMSFHS